MSSVKEFLNWCLIFLKSDKSSRVKMREILLKGISEYNEEAKQYAEWLSNTKNCQFVGFGVNIQYIKESGTKDEMKALWVHPFGGPVLVYKHKRLPMLIMTSPSLEYNDSHIKKAKLNNYTQNIEGITD